MMPTFTKSTKLIEPYGDFDDFSMMPTSTESTELSDLYDDPGESSINLPPYIEPTLTAADPKSTSSASPTLDCHATTQSDINWMDPNVLRDNILPVCNAVEEAKDKSSVSLLFNDRTPNLVRFEISWTDTKPTHSACKEGLQPILDKCDGKSDTNPFEWKHGGRNSVNGTTYVVTPLTPRYFHGTCGAIIYETRKQGKKHDGYKLRVFINDNGPDGKSPRYLYNTTAENGEEVGKEGKTAFVWNGLGAPLSVLPVAGDKLTTFKWDRDLNGNRPEWTTSKTDGLPNCVTFGPPDNEGWSNVREEGSSDLGKNNPKFIPSLDIVWGLITLIRTAINKSKVKSQERILSIKFQC